MMAKICMDFLKTCMLLLLVTSSNCQETNVIAPTSASRVIASQGGSCGTYNTYLHTECTFPDLFSNEDRKCKPFNETDCGNRTEHLTPCDYANSNCTRPHANATLCVCDEDVDLNYGMCLFLKDGDYAWPARHWSPYFIQCKSQRTLPSSCKGHSVIYNFFENKCQVVYEVVNAAYSLSLSLNIPESLYHLLSLRPTHFVPQTTQEISQTLLQPTHTSDIMKHSSVLAAESDMFTNTLFETTFSAIPKSESYNILYMSSLTPTPSHEHVDLSTYNSPPTTGSISSYIQSAETGSTNQPDISKQVTASTYPIPNQHQHSTETATFASSKLTSPSSDILSSSSKLTPPTSDILSSSSKLTSPTSNILSLQRVKIFSPVTSSTNGLSTVTLYTSKTTKQEQVKVTQSPSFLYTLPTTNENILSRVSEYQVHTSMESLSSSELPQTLLSSTRNLYSSKLIQTKPLFNSFKSSDFLSSTAEQSSSFYSDGENEMGTKTDFDSSSSPLKTSATISSLEPSSTENKNGTKTDFDSSSSPLTSAGPLSPLTPSSTENKCGTSNDFDSSSSPLKTSATLSLLAPLTTENKIKSTIYLDSSSLLASGAPLSSLVYSESETVTETTADPDKSTPSISTPALSVHSAKEIDVQTTTSYVNSSEKVSEATHPLLILSTSEIGTRTTKNALYASNKTTSSLESLSKSTQIYSDSDVTLKQTTLLPELTTSTIPPTQQTAPQSSSLLITSPLLPLSEFSSSPPQTSSFNPLVSPGNTTINTALPSQHVTSKAVMVLSHLASTPSMYLTTSHFDSILSSSSSITQALESSMQVNTKPLRASSSFSKVNPDIKLSEMKNNHVTDNHLSTSRSHLQESYIMSDSILDFEQTQKLYTSSKLDSRTHGGSMESESSTSLLFTTETQVPMKPSKFETENLLKISTSSEVLKTSYSLKESFTQSPTSAGVMGLKPTAVSLNKVTSELKSSILSSRESFIISGSSSIKSSVTSSSDFDHMLIQSIPSASESRNTLDTVKTFRSEHLVLKSSLTLAEGFTTSIKPSKTQTVSLTKSETTFERSASSQMIKPSVLVSREHSTTRPPIKVTTTINKPGDNSAERQKNTRTSIAIGAGVGGGIVLICIIILVVIIVLRKKNKKGKRDFFQVRLPPELFMSRSL